ncbi:fungal-specific transcription factor domain-containing protein [Hypoxylon crocopeplum]|nr:fungal-specific transcription factor domain-containing protein [Hypoxylon crocopeplum]
MATTSPCPSNISRPTHSCIRCAERKVKCDRNIPCNACVRHNVDCVYNPLQPPRNRRKRLNTKILTDRLKQCEALLREKGIDPNKLQHTPDSQAVEVVPNELQMHIPQSTESGSRPSVNKAQVIQSPGRFKLIDNILWTRMVEEFHDPQDALGDSSDDANDLEAFDDDFGFVLDNQLKPHTKSRHPPPEDILQLWQIFIENIDPLTKVVHVPTLRPAIQKATSNIEAVPRSFEALMFAIYSAAVMSLTNDECKQRLCEPRKVLLSRYISATKASLLSAKFMGTTSLVVLQALIIYLFAVRDIYEPRVVWSLTGVALRIAQGMGLERDGVYLGLPPFETEMRRRIWWQLKMHDFRTGELCGISKFQDLHIGAESTKWPTYINDDRLYPGMASLAAETNKMTDIVFISLKCDLLNYAAGRRAELLRQGKGFKPWDPHPPGSSTAEMEESSREIEELLEAKYLRYCDPSQPLHLMTMLMARCSINIIRFMSHHPRRWASREQTPPSERQWVWEICIRLLEQHNMLQSNPQLKRFAWHAPYFQQWHAIIHVLDSLRADPLNADAEKAWTHIGSTYENSPDMVSDMRKPIHVAVGNLCLKAYSTREAALQNRNIRPSPVPHFIVQLRQQREVVKARRQERHAKSGPPESLASYGQTNTFNNDPRSAPRPDNGVNNLSDTLDSTYLEQSRKPQPPGLSSSGTHISLESDPFQFTYGLDDGQIGDTNMDLGFMLDQDYDVEGTAMNTINWDQWDSWLTNSNVIRSFSSEEDFTTGT